MAIYPKRKNAYFRILFELKRYLILVQSIILIHIAPENMDVGVIYLHYLERIKLTNLNCISLNKVLVHVYLFICWLFKWWWWNLILITGINIFLDGFVPTENLRFRETSLTFKVAETAIEEEIKRMCRYEYPDMKKVMGKSLAERVLVCRQCQGCEHNI